MASPSISLLPIASLLPHERTLPARVQEIAREIASMGGVHALVASESGVVLDGHHRLTCLKRLGATLAPVVVVSYPSDQVRVLPRRKIRVTKSEVELRGQQGRPFPPKTTKHEFDYPLPSRRTSLQRLCRPVE